MASVKVVVHAKPSARLCAQKFAANSQANRPPPEQHETAFRCLGPAGSFAAGGMDMGSRIGRALAQSSSLSTKLVYSIFRPLLFSTPTQEHLPVIAHDPLHFLPSLPPHSSLITLPHSPLPFTLLYIHPET